MKSSTVIIMIICILIMGSILYIMETDGYKTSSYNNKIKIVEKQIRGDITTNMTISERMDIITFDCGLYFPQVVMNGYANKEFMQCKIDMKTEFIPSRDL